MIIKVDHSKFESTANKIDNYISEAKRKMNSMNNEMSGLMSGFSGKDAAAFSGQWDKVDEEGSVYRNMNKSLQSYSDFLREAGKKYRDAQTNAINRANRIW